MTDIQKVTEWMAKLKADLIQNYDRLGLRASGKWADELEDIVEESETGMRATMLGAEYTGIMTDGRRPNKDQSKEVIRAWVGWAGSTIIKDWVERKGIAANPFAVAYKIARKGIEVPNSYNPGTLLTDVITDERLDMLTNNILTSMVENVKSDLIKDLKNGN